MKIKTWKTQNETVVSVIGSINTENSSQLSDVLLSLDYETLNLVLDFNDTSYITSAGLRVLLVTRKKLSNETMRIINVNENIHDIFVMTGFSEFLNYSRKNTDSDGIHSSYKALLKQKCEEDLRDAIFTFRDIGYSWADVDCYSQIIAADLYALGVKKGSHVGICSVNSINWIFTFFAIQKLGAVAVLMNYALKPSEVITLSQIGDITHFCYGSIPQCTDYEAYVKDVCSEGSCISKTYYIGEDRDFTLRKAEYAAISGLFQEKVHADVPDVIIFTSGSTGLPKAVLNSADNIFRAASPVFEELHMNAEDRSCAFLPLFHIYGFATCIASALVAGPRMFAPERISPSLICSTIEKYKCTLLPAVPTLLFAITKLPDFSPKRVESLRASSLSGAPTGAAQMTYLRKLIPNCRFCNMYGMSELAAISITGYDDTVEHITKTVGKPVAGVEVEIRDISTGEKLTCGEPGEIFVRSPGMIVDYYHLPVEKQPLDEDGWLSTGDLGKLDEDGYISFAGRKKELIIRGGENVSPNEIAEVIASFPGISAVNVIGVPHEILGEEVCAVLVLKDSNMSTEKVNELQLALSAYIAERLAKFKVPAHYVVLPFFPMLGNGKLDTVAIKNQALAVLEERKNPKNKGINIV